MTRKTISISMLVIFSLVMLSACSGIATAAKLAGDNPVSPVNQPAQAQPTPVPVELPANSVTSALISAYQTTLENIYNKVNPSVVNIRVVMQQSQSDQSSQTPNFPTIPGFPFTFPNNPNDQTPQNQFSQALGSGFVWDKDGHIVTNNHVVADATKVEVTFNDGTTVPATVVSKDVDSDLAVIKVDIASDKLQPVEMADSQKVKVGQMVIAIGNPFGLNGTMTTGIVSGVGRSLPVNLSSSSGGPSYTIPDIIQTDASINPGNSGGVLVDDQGQVVGVTAAIESPTRSNAGVGFVIPSAIVQKVVPVLLKGSTFEHPWLGVVGTNLSPDLAKEMNLKSDQRGVLVEDVTSGGPAEKAGLRKSDRTVSIDGQDIKVGGDVITAIDNQPLNAIDELIAYLASHTDVGQKVTLSILRDGKQQTLDVTLGKRPQNTPQTQTTTQSVQPNQSNQTGPWLGIVGASVNSDIAQGMNLPSDTQGVLVQQVQSGSPADKAGIRGSFKTLSVNGQDTMIGGDVITAVDGKAISSLDDLRSLLQNMKAGQKVTLTILRDTGKLDVPVTLADRSSQ